MNNVYVKIIMKKLYRGVSMTKKFNKIVYVIVLLFGTASFGFTSSAFANGDVNDASPMANDMTGYE